MWSKVFLIKTLFPPNLEIHQQFYSGPVSSRGSYLSQLFHRRHMLTGMHRHFIFYIFWKKCSSWGYNTFKRLIEKYCIVEIYIYIYTRALITTHPKNIQIFTYTFTFSHNIFCIIFFKRETKVTSVVCIHYFAAHHTFCSYVTFFQFVLFNTSW